MSAPGRSEIVAAIGRAIVSARPGTPLPALTLEQSLTGDLGLSSLEVMKTALELERAFGIRLEEGAEFTVVSLGDLVDLLQRRLESAPHMPEERAHEVA